MRLRGLGSGRCGLCVDRPFLVANSSHSGDIAGRRFVGVGGVGVGDCEFC